MPGIVVTATGTDVGKTYVTAGLIRAGRRAGLMMAALKPILTGYDEAQAGGSDAGRLLEAFGQPVTAVAIARIAPWRFTAPLSPNMAAAAEGRTLDLATLATACRAALWPDRLTLIEGIGGVMVPLNARHTVLDLVAALALPVMLVTGTQLGALSHCLTAAAVLQARGCPPALIVLNESTESTVPLAATRDTLAAFCPSSHLAVVTRDAADETFDTLLAHVRAITT